MPASEERRVIQALAFIPSYYYCIIFPISLNCVRVLIKRYSKEGQISYNSMKKNSEGWQVRSQAISL